MTLRADAQAYARDYLARTGRKPTIPEASRALNTRANTLRTAAERGDFLTLFAVKHRTEIKSLAVYEPSTEAGLRRKAKFWGSVVRQLYPDRYGRSR